MSIKGMLITLIILPGILHISHGQSINGSHDSSRRYEPSPSFVSYMNPVIPGDHPDCTVTQIGDDFYTTGSSFNVTPVIYHSTDLVHWEAIAQPVSASWTNYEDRPGGGCWGGQMVLYNGEYWDFFSRANTMYFVKASDPRGPWSAPVRIKDPATISYGLGYDNSIFIDDSTILHGESECNRAQRNGFSFTENAKRGGDAAVLSLYLKSFELS